MKQTKMFEKELDGAVEQVTAKIVARGIRVDTSLLDKYLAELSTGTSEKLYRRSLMLQNISKRVKDGRLHPDLIVNGAKASGRFSCRSPNLHNMPRDYRNILLADKGLLLSLDYRQAELRVLAYLSGCQKLIDAFENGRDPYAEIAVELNIARDVAKIIAIGIPYGLTGFGVARKLRVSEELGNEIRSNYIAKFSELFSFIERKKAELRFAENPTTHYGHPIVLDRSEYETSPNQWIAAFIQGTAADILKKAMVALSDAGFDLVFCLHDEILLEVRDETEAAQASSIMVSVSPEIRMDVESSMGAHWE